jgi:hypothetical protein
MAVLADFVNAGRLGARLQAAAGLEPLVDALRFAGALAYEDEGDEEWACS